MRKLMRVIAACMAICIVDSSFTANPPSEVMYDIALLIEGSTHLKEESPPPRKRPEKDPDVALLEEIVASEMLRLNLFKGGFPNTYEEAARFIEFVKLIESNGNRYAKASTSTAMSFFQFTVPSVPTALNRLRNYMARNYLGELPPWTEALREDPTSLFEISETRQAILTLTNIIEQRGSDQLLIRFFGGERKAAKAIYYAHHHTDPDEATLKRTERIFAKVFK